METNNVCNVKRFANPLLAFEIGIFGKNSEGEEKEWEAGKEMRREGIEHFHFHASVL